MECPGTCGRHCDRASIVESDDSGRRRPKVDAHSYAFKRPRVHVVLWVGLNIENGESQPAMGAVVLVVPANAPRISTHMTWVNPSSRTSGTQWRVLAHMGTSSLS